MKTTVSLVVVCLLAIVGPALAQERTDVQPAPKPIAAYVWNGYEEIDLPPHPCGPAGLKGSDPRVLDGQLWIFYSCNDVRGQERVIARRFAPPTQNVPINPKPVIEPEIPPCHRFSPGFVPGIHGGCVPPDHPLARR